MAKTPSTMLKLGTKAPDFQLNDVSSGQVISLKNFHDKPALLIMFISRHCPYVVHVEKELGRLGKDFTSVGIIAICSNDSVAYPDDSPNMLAEQAKRVGFNFPYVFDESQAVAKSYRAACTPDLFLFDKFRNLVYRGQLDGSRPGNGIPVTGKDIRAAIEALLAGELPNEDQRPSIGCNIKWKPGNEPAY